MGPRKGQLRAARVHRAGGSDGRVLAPAATGGGAGDLPGHHRQRHRRNRRQLAGPDQVGAAVAAVFRRRRRRGGAVVSVSVAVRGRPGAVHLRPDPARRARRTLRLHRPGHGGAGDLRDDRPGPRHPERPCRRQRLARRGLAAARRRLVRGAVGAVDGAVRQPAGARAVVAAVPGVGPLPAAQGGPVRAGAAERPARAAAGAGRAERAGGGRTQRGQDRDHQPLRPLRPARRAVGPVFPPVLHGAGLPRARQFLALPVRGADRRVLPQRRAVPLPAPAGPAGQGLRGAGRGDPAAPAVRLRRADPAGHHRPARVAGFPARPCRPTAGAAARLAGIAGDQPAQHRAAPGRGRAVGHYQRHPRHPPARLLAAHPARDAAAPGPAAHARLGAVPARAAHGHRAGGGLRHHAVDPRQQRLLDPADHRLRVPAQLRRHPPAPGPAHRRHPDRPGRGVGADAAVPGHRAAVAVRPARHAGVLRHPHRPLHARHRGDHGDGAVLLQPDRRRLHADLAAPARHPDRLRDRRRRLVPDPAGLAGPSPQPGAGDGAVQQRALPGAGAGAVPQRHARRPALPHRPPRHAQRRRRAVGGAVEHAARARPLPPQPGCRLPLPGFVQHLARLSVGAGRASGGAGRRD
ncbi:hypothetical protein NB717_003817 [Xanthomonas sacchari]|nr:hypothetical protein [Xanthomonas sacchari]